MFLKSLKYCKIALFLIFSINISYSGHDSDSVLARKFERMGAVMMEKSQFDSSIGMYSKAAKIWEESSEWVSLTQCKIMIAYNEMYKGNHSFSYTILSDAESILHAKNIYSSELGLIYILQAYVHSVNEEHSTAIERISQGITVYKNTIGEENSTYASAIYALGLAQYYLGNYEDSFELLKRVENLQMKFIGKNNVQVATTKTLIGLVLDAKNEFDEAIDLFRESQEILLEHQKQVSPENGLLNLNLMSTYFNKGDYILALEHGKKSIDIYKKLDLHNDANIASAYSKIGEIYTAIEDLENAKFHLQRAMDIFSESYPSKKSAIGVIHQLLAKVYDRSGESVKALEHVQRGIEILESSYDTVHPQIGFMYEHVGDIFASGNRFDDALSYYKKAITAREQIGTANSRNDVALLNSSIAHLYTQQNRFDSASRYLAAASQIEKQSHQQNITQQAMILQRYGEMYRLMKKRSLALQYYHKAIQLLADGSTDDATESIPSFSNSIYQKELLDLVVQKSLLFEEQYAASKNVSDLVNSYRHYRVSLDLVDDLRKQYTADGSKMILSEKSASLYAEACRLAVTLFRKTNDPAYKEQAFLIADRSKANILLEKLFDGEAKQFAGIPDSLLEREKSIVKWISFLDIQIQKLGIKEGKGIAGTYLNKQKFDLRAEHSALVELFEHQYPLYYDLKYSRPIASLKEIQSKLGSGTLLVQYLVNTREIYLFTLSQNRLSMTVLPHADRIEQQIATFTDALRRYDADGYATAGAALYGSILRPVESSMRTAKNIVVIPDGSLHYVPFEALPMTATTSTVRDFTSIKYLITRFDVSYSYSAAFYTKMQRTQPRQKSTAYSFAGFAPVFRDSVKNGDFLANRSFVEESGISDVRSITLDGKRFNELKYSEEEVGSISRSFGEQTLPNRTFLHTDATETNFKQFSGKYDIVHVATHGFINEENPKLSAILFSQPSEKSMDDDGILYVNETFNLDLNADLVVLSSCESGVGKLVQGEGMLTLTRGLFYAGAKNIIYSLWKVSDKQTYLLMDRFYAEMLSGKSYTSSLRNAKLAMIASKESANPSKWSGFVLMGE